MATLRLGGGALLIVLAAVAAGCANTDDGDLPPAWDDGPGTKAWNNDDVRCESSKDCNSNEVCTNGICQMPVCMQPSYTSTAPLGDFRYFNLDREIAVVTDDAYVDTYEPRDASYQGSFDFSTTGDQVLDVAGGNFNGQRPQQFAYAHATSVVTLSDGSSVDVGFTPIAIAAGDVDADGVDELVAVGSDGTVASCHVGSGACDLATMNGVTGVDVTVADVDGDGFEEPVFLMKKLDKPMVVVWNLDKDQTGQDETVAWQFNTAGSFLNSTPTFLSIAAGDLDGDGNAEIVLLEDAGWYDYKSDRLHVFSAQAGQILGSTDVDGHSVDIAMGDTNGDGKSELVLLRSDRVVELRKNTSLDKAYEAPLQYGTTATRITTFDEDGDSPAGRLAKGPVLIAGNVIPTAVLVFPPYFQTWSAGRGSNVNLGEGTHQSESISQTISLHSGVTVTVGGSFGFGFGGEPGGPQPANASFSANASYYIMHDFARTTTSTTTISVGKNWSIDADPSLGRDYAGIVLAGSCYHAYQYVSEDPANKIGGDGQLLNFFVPVDAETQLWSTRRYNALVRATRLAPSVPIPYTLGDASTYPQSPQSLDGYSIDSTDMLFPSPPDVDVSDVGSVGFSLSASQSETNSTAQTTTIGTNATFGVGLGVDVGVGNLGVNVSVTGDQNKGFSYGYSLTVGKDTSFSGSVPPLPDNRNTPEDEFAAHRYSFSPFVYKQHYTDVSGGDSAYYVVTYTVGQ